MTFCMMNIYRSLIRDVQLLSVSTNCISRSEHLRYVPAACSPALHLNRSLHVSGRKMEEAEEAEEKTEEAPHNPLAMKVVDIQTSMRYMKSNAYKRTYGDALVWEPYRRNQRGPRTNKPTRKKCIRAGILSTGNPCPICRDVYLVVDPQNLDLLTQFICQNSGKILPSSKTNVCQEQQKKLTVALEQARDLGLIEKAVPFRTYDYTDYYPDLKSQSSK